MDFNYHLHKWHIKNKALLVICQSCLLLILSLFSYSQEVTISSDLEIRSSIFYDILGPINSKLYVYKDFGNATHIDIVNDKMQKTSSNIINENKQSLRPIYAMSTDSLIKIYQARKDKDSTYINVQVLDERLGGIDTSRLFSVHNSEIHRDFKRVVSEDKSKILFFNINIKGDMVLYLVDSRSDRIIWRYYLKVLQGDMKRDFFKTYVSDDGMIYIVLKDDVAYDRFEDFLSLLRINSSDDEITQITLNTSEFNTDDIELSLDNLHDKLIVAGVFKESKKFPFNGYYIFEIMDRDYSSLIDATLIEFEAAVVKEMLKYSKSPRFIFEHFYIIDIVHRMDGGLLLFTEYRKEVSRRNPYATPYGSYNRGGWIDYHYDELLICSLDPNYGIDWSEILHKRQFSQDDSGVYSSFGLVSTPSQLRLVYNDEIRKNSTVSEYLLDPGGNIKRNSIFSSEYQDIKLRFRDALQISNNVLIVPSENGNNLNLVKMTF